MPRIVIIGAGLASTMISHCIAVAAHLTEVIVVNLKELAIYQKETPTKEIILLYTAPQVDEFDFKMSGEKIEYDEILNLSLVSLIDWKYWYHLLWKPPKGIRSLLYSNDLFCNQKKYPVNRVFFYFFISHKLLTHIQPYRFEVSNNYALKLDLLFVRRF